VPQHEFEEIAIAAGVRHQESVYKEYTEYKAAEAAGEANPGVDDLMKSPQINAIRQTNVTTHHLHQ